MMLSCYFQDICFHCHFSRTHTQPLDPKMPYFWASRFPLPYKTKLWKWIPSTLRIQPKETLPILDHPSSLIYPKILAITEKPHFRKWKECIQEMKTSVPKLQKVVLARQTTWHFTRAVSPLKIFFHIKQKNPHAYPFMILLKTSCESIAFIGASPEKLFCKNGLLFETEAVASTAPLNEKHLLYRNKMIQEFLFVKKFLQKKLQKKCLPFSTKDELLVKQAGNLYHLYHPFTTILKKEISAEEMIRTLHPTPAIAGTPRKRALQFIKTHELFDRGLYAGTIGIISPEKEQATICVAIRSCLIQGNKMHIFAGAGITHDSDPEKEWEELNQKQKLFEV